MIEAPSRVVITGAGGFIGARLTKAILEHPRLGAARLTLVDLRVPSPPNDARVRVIEGDMADAAVRSEALAEAPSLVFHLAGVLGGAAEADYALARRVNVDGTLSLFEDLRGQIRPPRLVFASSIAVFGPSGPDRVDDDTRPDPSMTYGAQKLMMEIALEQFSARGWLDGIAVRLPGVVARHGADTSLKSAFLNRIFYAVESGQHYVMPVSPEGTSWLISVGACVDALIHAAMIPADALRGRRSLTLPAQQVRMKDLVAALARRFPKSGARIDYRPDPALQAQFANQPSLSTTLGDHLGFVHDGDLDTLVARAMSDMV